MLPIWAAFLYGYPSLHPYILPTKNAQRHAVLSWYMYSGAPPSCNSCYVCTVMRMPIVVRHNKTDSFPHLIQKHRSQLGFVTYLLNCPRTLFSFKVACTATDWAQCLTWVQQHNSGLSRLTVHVSRSHTTGNTSGRTLLNDRPAHRRGHYLHNTQQTQKTNICAVSGIRTGSRVVIQYFSSFACFTKILKQIPSLVLFVPASMPFYSDMLFTTLPHVQRSCEH
jgi:hypothetical protein